MGTCHQNANVSKPSTVAEDSTLTQKTKCCPSSTKRGSATGGMACCPPCDRRLGRPGANALARSASMGDGGGKIGAAAFGAKSPGDSSSSGSSPDAKNPPSSKPSPLDAYESSLPAIEDLCASGCAAYRNGEYGRAYDLFREAEGMHTRAADTMRRAERALARRDRQESGGCQHWVVTERSRLDETASSLKRRKAPAMLDLLAHRFASSARSLRPKAVHPMETRGESFSGGGHQKGSERTSSGSLDDTCHGGKLPAKTPPPTSYIYQRMDFDEGMHAYPDTVDLPGDISKDLSDCWQTSKDLGTTQVGKKRRSPSSIRRIVGATVLFNMGQCLRRDESLDEAKSFYQRAQRYLVSNPSSTVIELAPDSDTQEVPPSLAVHILHNIGQLQYRRGLLKEAIKTYQCALKHAERAEADSCATSEVKAAVVSKKGCEDDSKPSASSAFDDESKDKDSATSADMDQTNQCSGSNDSTNDDVAATLNSLGVLHYHASSDESDLAMSEFKRALDLRRARLGPDHQDAATVLNNMGRVHVQKDEFDDALKYYEEALRIRKEKLGPNSLDYAATAFNAGQSLHQRGDLERALELYKEFLRVANVQFDQDHRDVAVVLSGIAQIHQERGEHDKALELYEESLRCGRAALGEYHSEVAMLLNRIGNFHFEREDLDAALRSYREGLRIERAVLEPDHPNVVVTLSNLGEIHRQRGEWDDAIRLYSEALELQRRRHGPKHPDVASSLNTLGLIHDQKGDACAALRYLQDALIMRRSVLGNDHLDLSATLTYVGTILYRKNMLGVAMDLFSESLRIRKDALGPDHRDVAFTLYNVALIHQQRGSYEEAIECYRETLRVERLVLGDRHRDVAMTLYKLGEAHKAHNDLEGALQYFEEALDIERGTLGEEDPATLARTLNEIGNIHLARGDVVPMMEAFNEAARIYRRAGLSPNNLIVSGQLYAFDVSCPEAAPAA